MQTKISVMLSKETLIISKTFKPNLRGFKNLGGLVSGIIEFSFLSLMLVFLLLFSSAQAVDVKTVQAQSGKWRQRYEAFGKVTAQSESFLQLPYSIHITVLIPTLERGNEKIMNNHKKDN